MYEEALTYLQSIGGIGKENINQLLVGLDTMGMKEYIQLMLPKDNEQTSYSLMIVVGRTTQTPPSATKSLS